MFKRYLDGKLPKHSFFLFGPRQTGKSTLLEQIQADIVLDLLNPGLQLQYAKDPELLLRQVDLLPKAATVFIDEIQKVPALLDVVQVLMERSPKLRIVMSGSSARKLRRGASNLLGGRALYRTLHPLTGFELAEQFHLDWALRYGTLPKVTTVLLEKEESLAQDILRSYIITYLQEEIKAEALVRNLQGFQNFLDITFAQFSEQVNFTDVGRQCGVAYATVRDYYAILEDTLIGFFLPPYLKSMRKRMSHSPKFYCFDNGVTRAVLGLLRTAPSLMEQGRLFEQWGIQEVYRLNQYKQKDWQLCFWRTAHGAEVDLVIEYGKTPVCAIEFKHKTRLSTADLTGLRSFRDVFPKLPCYIVAPIVIPQQLDFAEVWPLPRLLEHLDRSF